MGSFDKSRQRSSSVNQSTAQSFIAPQQVQFLGQLLGGTGDVLTQQAGVIGPAAGELSRGLLGQGQDFLGQLSGQQAPGVGAQIGALSNVSQDPTFQSLLGSLQGGGGPGTAALQGIAGGGIGPGGPLAGTQALQGLTGPGSTGLTDALLQENPALQGQLSQLDLLIQNNLRSTTGTLAGQATLQGATGGSRQALSAGLLGQEAQRGFRTGASALISQDFAARQALAPQLQALQQQGQLAAAGQLQQGDIAQRGLGLVGQGQQLGAAQALQQGGQFAQAGISGLLAQQFAGQGVAGQLGLGQAGLQGAASLGGLGQLGGQFNLGLAPFAAQFSPFLAASQIFGAPTVLSRQQASGSSNGFGRSIGVAIAGSAAGGGGGGGSFGG